MALQIPQNAAMGAPQTAGEQINPAQQFGHLIEQQAASPKVPNAPQFFDTDSIVAKAGEHLGNVIQDTAAKFKALKAAEEHATLQTDAIDIQQKFIDARKEAADYASKEGLNIDEQSEDYTRRRDNILNEYPPDRFSDPDIRRAATVRNKEMDFNDKRHYEENVVNPGRIATIKTITALAESKFLLQLENNPQITAEEADATKLQLGEMYNSPFALSTLGPDVANAQKLQMYSRVDQKLVDNRMEGMNWKGIEGAATMEDARALAEQQRSAAEALITNRPSLSSEQADKLKDKLNKRVEQSLIYAERGIKARHQVEYVKAHSVIEHDAFAVIEGLRTGKTTFGAATGFQQKMQDKSDEAFSAGNDKLGEYYLRKSDDVQRGKDSAQTRAEARANREMMKQIPLMQARQIINANQVITDAPRAEALYEDLTKKMTVTQNTERVMVIAPYLPQMSVLPSQLKADFKQLTLSKDQSKVQTGYKLLDQAVKTNPSLINQFDDETVRSYHKFKLGLPLETIATQRDAEAKISQDLLKSRDTDFHRQNVPNSKSPNESKVNTAISKKLGVSLNNIPDHVRVAVTSEAESQYRLLGNMDSAIAIAADKYLQTNPDAQHRTFGKSKYAPKETVMDNPPELLIHDQEGFGRQLNKALKLSNLPTDPDAPVTPLKEGDYRLEFKGKKAGNPVYTVYGADPLTGTLIKPITDFVFDPVIEQKRRDDKQAETVAKDKASRDAEILAQKQARESSLVFDAEVAAKKKVESNRTAAPTKPATTPSRRTLINSDQVLPFGK